MVLEHISNADVLLHMKIKKEFLNYLNKHVKLSTNKIQITNDHFEMCINGINGSLSGDLTFLYLILFLF